jgi:hypothetical protein
MSLFAFLSGRVIGAFVFVEAVCGAACTAAIMIILSLL